MKYFNKKAEKIWKDFVLANYQKIEVTPGQCRWNYKCHLNTVHEAVKHNDKKLALCLYVDGNFTILHFLNYRKGKYIDNTLGEWSARYDYYFVKWITAEEYWNIGETFDSVRDDFTRKLPLYIRIFCKTTV